MEALDVRLDISFVSGGFYSLTSLAGRSNKQRVSPSSRKRQSYIPGVTNSPKSPMKVEDATFASNFADNSEESIEKSNAIHLVIVDYLPLSDFKA